MYLRQLPSDTVRGGPPICPGTLFTVLVTLHADEPDAPAGRQGAQPSFSSSPVPLLNYSAAISGGLMAIAGQANNFAMRFTGPACDRMVYMSSVRPSHACDDADAVRDGLPTVTVNPAPNHATVCR